MKTIQQQLKEAIAPRVLNEGDFVDFEEWINSYSEYQDSDTATLVEEFNTSFGNTRVKETGKIAWGKLKMEIIDDFNRTGTADSVFEKYGFALNDESTLNRIPFTSS